MAKLSPHQYCTGCAACAAICPCDAIKMIPDGDGFLYPVVDAKSCVECGLCSKTCPSMEDGKSDNNPKCFASRSKDEKCLMASTSGGVSAEIARAVLESGGVVYGVGWSNDGERFKACHIRIATITDLHRIQGSKYVQSEVLPVYRQIRDDLKSGMTVLFTGTPCQVAGVRKFVGKGDKNLVLVEVICHGVPSPEMFSRLCRDLRSKYRNEGKIVNVSFRSKEPTWGHYQISSLFENGRVKKEDGDGNAYLFAFINRMIQRKSCANCRSNNGRSGADITLGDYWGLGNEHPKLNDGRGCSAVMVHSEKGEYWLLKSSVDLEEANYSHVLAGNVNYTASRPVNKFAKYFTHLWPIFGFRVSWRIYLRIHGIMVRLGLS